MSSPSPDKLRDWLQGTHDGSEVEQYVREAVYILSPERAPYPSKSIEEIFSQLSTGPLALEKKEQEDNFERETSFFQNIKTGHAPHPKRSIDDLFGALQEGPLSSQNQERNQASNVVALTIQPELEEQVVRSKPRYWRIWGTLVAAAAMIFLGVQYNTMQPVMIPLSDRSSTSEKSIFVKESAVEERAEFTESDNIVEEETMKDVAVAPKKSISRTEAIEKPMPRASKSITKESFARKAKKKAKPPSPEIERKAKSQEEKKPESIDVASMAERTVLEDKREMSIAAQYDAEPMSSVAMEKEVLLSSIDILRIEALRGENIPRSEKMKKQSQEELKIIIQNAETDQVFLASYEIAIRYPRYRSLLESVLRLKGATHRQKRFLYILIGDVYRMEGKNTKTEELYRAAKQLPD